MTSPPRVPGLATAEREVRNLLSLDPQTRPRPESQPSQVSDIGPLAVRRSLALHRLPPPRTGSAPARVPNSPAPPLRAAPARAVRVLLAATSAGFLVLVALLRASTSPAALGFALALALTCPAAAYRLRTTGAAG